MWKSVKYRHKWPNHFLSHLFLQLLFPLSLPLQLLLKSLQVSVVIQAHAVDGVLVGCNAVGEVDSRNRAIEPLFCSCIYSQAFILTAHRSVETLLVLKLSSFCCLTWPASNPISHVNKLLLISGFQISIFFLTSKHPQWKYSHMTSNGVCSNFQYHWRQLGFAGLYLSIHS